MKLVKRFYRSWSWIAASVGVVLPEIIQVISDNSALITYLDPDTTNLIRLGCLILVIVLRPIKQKSLNDEG